MNNKTVKIISKGNFNKTEKFFNRLLEPFKMSDFDKYGKMGVKLLSANTPEDTGLTASSWSYDIVHDKGKLSIIWSNSNENDGQVIAILLQYGHATNNGGYVKGRDYINPALQPLFDKMLDDIWEEVIHA